MPDPKDCASHVLMAIGSVLALLSLGLPFALETRSNEVGDSEKILGGTRVWSRWSLAHPSEMDSHLPPSNAAAVALWLVVAAALPAVLLAAAQDANKHPAERPAPGSGDRPSINPAGRPLI